MTIPTLSKHYDLTITQVLVKLFKYFLISDYSQTNIYRGHITSLKYLTKDNKGDDLLTAIDKQLTIMYRRYFTSDDFVGKLNEISVDSYYDRIKDSAKLLLRIKIKVVIDGKLYSLNESADADDIDSLLENNIIDELAKKSKITVFNVTK